MIYISEDINENYKNGYYGDKEEEEEEEEEKEENEEIIKEEELKRRVNLVKETIKGLSGPEIGQKIVNNWGSTKRLTGFIFTSYRYGLNNSAKVIEKRKKLFGENKVEEKKQKKFIFYIIEASKDVTLFILFLAAVVSLSISCFEFYGKASSSPSSDPTKSTDWIEGATILICILIIITVTALNNWEKERKFKNLKSLVQSQIKFAMLRSGGVAMVKEEEVVVGDICLLKSGDCIPADGILLQGMELQMDESSLTGESKAVKKSPFWDPLIISGSHVLEGSGKMVVLAVGAESHNGKIIEKLIKNKKFGESKKEGEEEEKDEEVKSILKKKMDRLSVQIGYFGLIMSCLTLVVLVTRFSIEKFVIEKLPWQREYIQDFIGFLLISIVILVIAIPEGLPLAVLLSLVIAAKRMMKDKNLVRHLGACEVMGCATSICSDKTGTLTTNHVTVVSCFTSDNDYHHDNNMKNLPPSLLTHLFVSIALNTSYLSTIEIENGVLKQIGNKTDCGFLGLLRDLGVDYRKIRSYYGEDEIIKIFTFTSTRKYMATLIKLKPKSFIIPYLSTASLLINHHSFFFDEGDGRNNVEMERENKASRLFVKGAFEIILQKCTHVLKEDGTIEKINDRIKKKIVEKNINSSANSQRTLVLALRDFYYFDEMKEEQIINDLVFICVVAMEDPIRTEVPMAIKQCKKAGIVVKMVTGDSLPTALSVARKCGIIFNREEMRKEGRRDGERNENQELGDYEEVEGVVMDTKEFNNRIRKKNSLGEMVVDQNLLDKVWPRLRVLARSTPEDKFNLVKGMMESKIGGEGQVVAVTGDGTNDAPALKKAHVGFAMGLTGTEVSKRASDIILTDDNFSSIVKATMWGRHVFQSIQKFLQFQLTVNLVAVFIAFISACFLADTPIKSVQMIWINLLQDTLASLSLSTEFPSEKLLEKKSKGKNQKILSPLLLVNIFTHATFQLAILLSILFTGDELLHLKSGEEEDVRGEATEHFTFVFNVLVLMSLFNEINCRKIDGTLNVFQGILSSYVFVTLWILSLLLQIIIIEFGGKIFFTQPLPLTLWLWSIFFALSQLLFAALLNIIRIEVEYYSKLKMKTQKKQIGYRQLENETKYGITQIKSYDNQSFEYFSIKF